jgi:hypothetical protein
MAVSNSVAAPLSCLKGLLAATIFNICSWLARRRASSPESDSRCPPFLLCNRADIALNSCSLHRSANDRGCRRISSAARLVDSTGGSNSGDFRTGNRYLTSGRPQALHSAGGTWSQPGDDWSRSMVYRCPAFRQERSPDLIAPSNGGASFPSCKVQPSPDLMSKLPLIS